MAISLKTIKIVWGLAAGRCSYPGCRLELVLPPSGGDPESVVGEIAHIVARKSAGPRGDPTLAAQELNTPSNLLLLCPLHHKLIDDQPKTHSVAALRSFKCDHEHWVRENLARAADSQVDSLPHPPVSPSERGRDLVSADPLELEEELVSLRRRIAGNPTDGVGWQLLASVQYRLRRYLEALESLEQAYATGAFDQQLDQLRAAILTESVRPGEKAGLLEARDIFTKLAAGSREWVHHYNLGNVLKALEDPAKCHSNSKVL